MTVSTIGNTGNAVGNGNSGNAPVSLSDQEQAFLKLLTTELQHQDPTQPTDPAQYMSQMSMFSSLQQQVTINANLGMIISLLQEMVPSHTAPTTGTTVPTTGGTTTPTSGTTPPATGTTVPDTAGPANTTPVTNPDPIP